jgi:1,4-dihydroxy-6-naphthoate synthase
LPKEAGLYASGGLSVKAPVRHFAQSGRSASSSFKGRRGLLDFRVGPGVSSGMAQKLTLGHSPDPDDAFMFYGLARKLIPTAGFEFEHILQDIQTLNQRATRGELDITAISIHAYAYVSADYALLPSGASMGDGYGPMLVAKKTLSRAGLARSKIAVPGTMTSAFLALQLWLQLPAEKIHFVVVPFDKIFEAVHSGEAEAGLIIHEGQLTCKAEGLKVCQDLGAWWQGENDGLPLPLGGNVIHKRLPAATRSIVARILANSIQFSLDHRAEAVAHALPFARNMGEKLADQFVGMYVNHWTLDYGEKGRAAIERFLGQAYERGLIPQRQELEFVKPAEL